MAAADDNPLPPSDRAGDFTLKKALFEIAIVAVGVLLALLVDQARQSSADRALAEEARSALRAEVEENRVRLATKLSLLYRAYLTLRQDPGAGPALVAQGSNFQIEMTDAAWTMAMHTVHFACWTTTNGVHSRTFITRKTSTIGCWPRKWIAGRHSQARNPMMQQQRFGWHMRSVWLAVSASLRYALRVLGIRKSLLNDCSKPVSATGS